MEQVKPSRRELRIVHKIRRVINAKTVDHVSRESRESMIQSHYMTRASQAPEAFNNQLLAQPRHHGLELRHACAGEVRVEGLSPLAVEVMFDRREMRSLEVNDPVDESTVSVRGADGARNVELIVVFRVTNRQLVRVDSYDRPCIDCAQLLLLDSVGSICTYRICRASSQSQIDIFLS